MSIPAAKSGNIDPLLASLSSSIPFPASSTAAPHDDSTTGDHTPVPASRKDSTSTAGFAESTYEDARSVTTGGSLYSAQMGSQSTITREVDLVDHCDVAAAGGAMAAEEAHAVGREHNVSSLDKQNPTHELSRDTPKVDHASSSGSASTNEKTSPREEQEEQDFTIGRTTGMGLSEKGGMGEKGQKDEEKVAMDDPELAALTAFQRKIVEEQM
jgi:hypothetical protein